MASSLPLSQPQVGGDVQAKRRRRPPFSIVERERRVVFGNQWGQFLRQASIQLREGKTK